MNQSKKIRRVLEIIIAVLLIFFGGNAVLETGTISNPESVISSSESVFSNSESETQSEETESQDTTEQLSFRNSTLLTQHYEKHGIEMGFSSEEEYEAAAALVVSNPDSLHKTEAEDGDDVYYLEETNEFVVVSTDGYIRTYFLPNSGIAYYNRQ